MARLQLHTPDRRPIEPPSRGPLLSAQVIQARLAAAGLPVTLDWIRRHVRPMVVLSAHKKAWYERDFEEWLDGRRVAR